MATPTVECDEVKKCNSKQQVLCDKSIELDDAVEVRDCSEGTKLEPTRI